MSALATSHIAGLGDARAGVRLFSIRHHAIALMHGLDLRRFAVHEHLGLGAVTAIAALVCVGLTLLSVRRLRRLDVP